MYPLMRTSGVKNTEYEVCTTLGGYRLGTSIDGALTGRGADLIIIDDPLKPADALNEGRRTFVNNWFHHTLLSRLDDMAAGAIIVPTQRLHEDDLTGALVRGSQEWVHLRLPAIAEVDEEIAIGPDKFDFRRAGDILIRNECRVRSSSVAGS